MIGLLRVRVELAVALVGGAASWTGCGGCASETPIPEDLAVAMDSSTAPDLRSPAASDGPGGSDGMSTACLPKPLPNQVPAGWREFTDWSCDCRFYIPQTKAALPAPIVWEACGSGSPPGLTCRKMAVDWTTTDPSPIGGSPKAEVDASGRVTMRFTRFNGYAAEPWQLWMVADADGPVLSALMSVNGASKAGCTLWDFSEMREGRVAYLVTGHDSNGDFRTSMHHGAIGGPIDDLVPTVLVHHVDTFDYAFYASSQWLGQLGPGSQMKVASWAAPASFQVIASASLDPSGIPPAALSLRGGDAFWLTGSLSERGIMAWTKAAGAAALARWPGDETRGAWDFGTDGKDMVWEMGEDRPVGSSPLTPFPKRSVMTSPYTTSPSQLKTRRLRSDPGTGGVAPYAVGCGYAAHTDGNHGLFVVRLLDGVAWNLAPEAGWWWSSAITLSCSEVFAVVIVGATGHIVRVRLDSLGTGLPPD